MKTLEELNQQLEAAEKTAIVKSVTGRWTAKDADELQALQNERYEALKAQMRQQLS